MADETKLEENLASAYKNLRYFFLSEKEILSYLEIAEMEFIEEQEEEIEKLKGEIRAFHENEAGEDL